jgi:hypothetical protein
MPWPTGKIHETGAALFHHRHPPHFFTGSQISALQLKK